MTDAGKFCHFPITEATKVCMHVCARVCLCWNHAHTYLVIRDICIRMSWNLPGNGDSNTGSAVKPVVQCQVCFLSSSRWMQPLPATLKVKMIMHGEHFKKKSNTKQRSLVWCSSQVVCIPGITHAPQETTTSWFLWLRGKGREESLEMSLEAGWADRTSSRGAHIDL